MLELSFQLLSFFFLIPSIVRVRASFDDYTSFVYVGCSHAKYTVGTPYQLNVDSLLISLANAAALSTYGNFTCDTSSATFSAYGLFQCSADLPISDCASCVRSALDRLSSLCPSAEGAGVQLKGYFLRYSNESFLGKPDTTLFYKKCGSVAPPGNYDSQLLSTRDAALAGLSGGGESFRVGAGCVGDQSAKQCSECMTEPVRRARRCSELAARPPSSVQLARCEPVHSGNYHCTRCGSVACKLRC